MATGLLEIRPRELNFIFEVTKQSTCSIQLSNISQQYVAFKVKTTSPKQYSVRPNVGIVPPNSVIDFTVTMQALRVAPPDLICKDKFLIQSTVVPEGTKEKDITSSVFDKYSGNYIEQSKMKVVLIPGHSPSPSRSIEILDPLLAHEEASERKNEVINDLGEVYKSELFEQTRGVVDEVKLNEDVQIMKSSLDNYESKLHEAEATILRAAEEKNGNISKKGVLQESNVVSEKGAGGVEVGLNEDIQIMKSCIDNYESKLQEAEASISKLREEKNECIREKEALQKESVHRERKSAGGVEVEFPFLFICMVALVSFMLGCLLRQV